MRKLENYLSENQGKEEEAQENELEYCNITAGIPNGNPAFA
jgi:hypothetical protein